MKAYGQPDLDQEQKSRSKHLFLARPARSTIVHPLHEHVSLAEPDFGKFINMILFHVPYVI